MSNPSLANPRHERLARLGKRALWRLAGGVLVLWAVATLTFFALRLMPG
ncbi:ABC transporter permease, partial [Pseudomonas gingeri]|nr:ABC transporter permease [Pseudomonas gingeri]